MIQCSQNVKVQTVMMNFGDAATAARPLGEKMNGNKWKPTGIPNLEGDSTKNSVLRKAQRSASQTFPNA